MLKCDHYFNAFNGKGLKLCHDPLAKVQNFILKKNPNFPPRIVKLFCKVKFYSRIKQLNVKLKLQNARKSVRALKQTAQFIN